MFLWNGHSDGKHHEAGVGFAITTNLVNKLICLPKRVNDRVMTIRLPLTGKCYATIISAYAPTLKYPVEVKEKIYEDLKTLIISVPKEDKFIILGDLNARIDTNYQIR